MTLLAPARASGATPIFNEVFGDDIISVCDSTWFGDCEADWSSQGSDESLDMCSVGTGSSTNWGVGIYGGTMSTGISRNIALSGNEDGVDLEVRFRSLSGSGQVGARLVFRDASGVSLQVEEHVVSVSSDTEGWLLVGANLPVGSVSVDVQFAVIGTGHWVVVDEFDVQEDRYTPSGTAASYADCLAYLEAIRAMIVQDCEGEGGTMSLECKDPVFYPSGKCEQECEGTCVTGPDIGSPEPSEFQCFGA